MGLDLSDDDEDEEDEEEDEQFIRLQTRMLGLLEAGQAAIDLVVKRDGAVGEGAGGGGKVLGILEVAKYEEERENELDESVGDLSFVQEEEEEED